MVQSASVTIAGAGPRVLFVHGSIIGAETWAAQQALAERWTTVVLERRGFGQSPPAVGEDYEVDAADIADALGGGAHLVAHSYGAVGAMLAAAAHPAAVRSLTLVEPVAYTVAIDHPAVQQTIVDLISLYTKGPQDPRGFLDGFLRVVGMPAELPARLPLALAQSTMLLMKCRPPFAARIRLDELAQAGIPTLVVSGGHSEVFDVICDRLEEGLKAERAVIPGAQHAVPLVGAAFNERLEHFLDGVS